MISKAWVALFITVALLALFNIATIELFPIVWEDEIMFTDAAANLAIDGKFVSTAWPNQPDSLMWASNAPLYSLIFLYGSKYLGFQLSLYDL